MKLLRHLGDMSINLKTAKALGLAIPDNSYSPTRSSNEWLEFKSLVGGAAAARG
jgi:hypothetical protein